MSMLQIIKNLYNKKDLNTQLLRNKDIYNNQQYPPSTKV